MVHIAYMVYTIHLYGIYCQYYITYNILSKINELDLPLVVIQEILHKVYMVVKILKLLEP